MNQADGNENYLSETIAEQGVINNNLKLVPVAESIRYRKRAQAAEKEAENLTEQLERTKAEADQIAEELKYLKTHQKLTEKLASAGAVDLETAALLARARMKDSGKPDIETVIEQLKREKQYLFASNDGGAATTRKTATVRQRAESGHTILARAAKKASATGNRTDLQEYLKLRRNFL